MGRYRKTFSYDFWTSCLFQESYGYSIVVIKNNSNHEKNNNDIEVLRQITKIEYQFQGNTSRLSHFPLFCGNV